jgi:hypothetical protein
VSDIASFERFCIKPLDFGFHQRFSRDDGVGYPQILWITAVVPARFGVPGVVPSQRRR